jgi:RNA polymerase sigma factor (sigma-70 family)
MTPINPCEPIAPSSANRKNRVQAVDSYEGDDHSLLAAYVNGSDTAFSALVRRHLDLVYSAALRQVRDPHSAADVTSAVFTVLARKAADLRAAVVIPAWLHSTTRFAALKAIRARVRREHYEQEAARMQQTLQNDESLPRQEEITAEIAPLLDQSLSRLSRKDHEAIILRFFQNKSFPEIASVVGSTEEAVRKRVDRAVQKLREFLGHRALIVTSEDLTGALAKAVRPSPPSLESTITGTIRPFARTQPGNTAPALVCETLQALQWHFWKPILATGIILLLASASVVLLLQRQTSASLASPLNTFRLLNRASASGDGARWSTFVHVTTPEEQQVRNLLASNVVAQAEVRRALLQQFGRADYERSPFPRRFDDTPESQIATIVQTTNGDQATLRFQRGSNLKFIRVDGAWKFDFFRTTSATPAQLRPALETNTSRLKTLPPRIRAGEFPTSAAAALALQNEF